MKCSIVISNYNYGRYLPQAIESALGQHYHNIEVIVVDDGSTDGSHLTLERYKSRITAIRKPNGGEASSRNVGLRHCTGDIVIFLDADDFLYPHAVSHIIDRFGPGVAKVHYPLDVVDADGRKTGEVMAAQLGSGDMTGLLREFGFYPSPPTSGNAYARHVVEKIAPIPEARFGRGADPYQIAMSALYGEVRAVGVPCAAWRRHGRNTSSHNVARLPGKLRDELEVTALVSGVLRQRGVHALEPAAAWPQHLQQRMTVTKLLPEQRVCSDDVVVLLAVRYVRAVWRWPAYGLRKRLAATAWALMFALIPLSTLARVTSDPGRMTSLVYRFTK